MNQGRTLDKDMTRELAESEKRLRTLVNAMSDEVYRLSADWSSFHLLDKGSAAPVSFTRVGWLEKYIAEEDRDRVRGLIADAIRDKVPLDIEHRSPVQNGKFSWMASRVVPVLDDDQNITEWIGSARDITRRKNTEQQLGETRKTLESSKRLYDAIISGTPDLVYVFNLDYRFIYANRALLAMWGRSEEDAMGRGLLELGYEPWHAEMHEREIDHVVATGETIRGEVGFPHATLGRRIYDYIFAPVLDENGKVVAVSGTTRDISDLKNAQEALKKSEEQFRSLTESVPQLICTSETNGSIDFFNQRWYEFTGSTPELSLGNAWLLYVHPKQRETIRKKWQKSIESGRPVSAEFQLRGRNGAYNWFHIMSNPLRDEQGNVYKWVATLSDIEEQKAVEERLEQLVEERTSELRRSNDDLLQFAHVASHDLKEPVRKVRTFADRLEQEMEGRLTEKASLYLEKIYSAVDRMTNMIEGVLRYSTLSNLYDSFADVDLNIVMRNIETDLEVAIQQKGAGITYGNLPVVHGSAVLLYQLFYNLVNNALKFGRTDAAPLISVTSTASDKAWKIDISDNGIGFPQNQAELIFHTFTRLNPKDRYEGTGLGLALCKKIVERHGGSITASAAEGKGATFHITLPR